MGDNSDGGTENENEYDAVIVIDNGSGLCKAGLSTHDTPSAVFPSCLGFPRAKYAKELKSFYCGDEIGPLRNKLTTQYPVENGIIQNFEHMEALWEYTLDEVLKIEDATRHPILLTEPPYNPKPTRERMIEIMFETFQVPEVNLSIQGVLALLGQGRTTGLVLDSGDGVSHTIPVFDGFGLPSCIQRLDLGGRDLNVFLAKLLAQKKVSLTTSSDREFVKNIKEECCYVSLDPTGEVAETKDFTLPDGRVISLKDERWKCAEALFQPTMVGLETGGGLGGLVWDTIRSSDIDVRPALMQNIILSGGSTLFPNFPERLHKELLQFAPGTMSARIRVIDMPDRMYAVWTGAQVFANLRSLETDTWMTSEDYDEHGASYIHGKLKLKYN